MGAHLYAPHGKISLQTGLKYGLNPFLGQPHPPSKVLFCPDQQALNALQLEEIFSTTHMKIMSFAHLLLPAAEL